MNTPRRLSSLSLGFFVVLSLPNHRAEGALLSAETLEEFSVVQGEYSDCVVAGGSSGKCFKMVLDPENVVRATIDVVFPTNAVKFLDTNNNGQTDMVDAVFTGLNGYHVIFNPRNFTTDDDFGITTLTNIKVIHTGTPDDGPLNILHAELAQGPLSSGLVTFDSRITDVTLVGGGRLVNPSIARIPSTRIPVPEPSSLSMLAAFFLGVVPLRRSLLKR